MMGKRHRLRALQMSITGHRGREMAARDVEQGLRETLEQRQYRGDFVAQIKAEIQRHLIIARTPRMQLLTRRADLLRQPALDREMDILVRDREAEVTFRDFALDRA